MIILTRNGLITNLGILNFFENRAKETSLILFVNKDLISKIINKETELLVNRLAKVKCYTNLKEKEIQSFSKFLYKNIPFNILYKNTNNGS